MATVLVGLSLYAQPSCDDIRKTLEAYGPRMAMIDMIPDLVKAAGIVTDAEQLAVAGQVVTGIVADGNSIALLRFPANFAGEKIQITVLNSLRQPSGSVDLDGGLSQIAAVPSGNPTPFASFHFAAGPVVVTAVESRVGTMAFVLYRAPGEFDPENPSRSIKFRVRSLDRPCFNFDWPSGR